MSELLSVVIPAYNEKENIPLIYQEVNSTFKNLPNYTSELLFVDDGSSDGTSEVLKDLSKKDPSVKFLCFSRNFGKEIATSAGLHYANGKAAIVMDADLQHPPALIPEFISKWKDGAEVVIGLRKKNENEGLVKKYGSIIFYKIMNRISEMPIIPCTTDFRLIDRKVIDVFCQLTERNRMTRGLIDWLGFKRDFVHFEAPARVNGEASYSYRKLLRLALNSFVSHSLFPLRLAGYLGGFITVVSALTWLFVVVEKYVLNDPWHLLFSGTAVLALLILFLVGIILSCFGLVAMYIANIHNEVLNRPLYIVSDKNF
ncbi:MAG: glycosyltransferase family 2 protein [Patescibacteria group bacterium]